LAASIRWTCLGPAQEIASRLDKLKDLKSVCKAIPFHGAAGRVADLKVADPSSGELAPLGPRLNDQPNRWVAQPREDAGVDEMGQRHACSRASRSARASKARRCFAFR
jgi:hypothetical protein